MSESVNKIETWDMLSAISFSIILFFFFLVLRSILYLFPSFCFWVIHYLFSSLSILYFVGEYFSFLLLLSTHSIWIWPVYIWHNGSHSVTDNIHLKKDITIFLKLIKLQKISNKIFKIGFKKWIKLQKYQIKTFKIGFKKVNKIANELKDSCIQFLIIAVINFFLNVGHNDQFWQHHHKKTEKLKKQTKTKNNYNNYNPNLS